MKPDGDGFADAVLPADRRARLRGRPSGLKGRCAVAAATGLRPALDPGGLCGPWASQGRRACPQGLPWPRPRGAAPGYEELGLTCGAHRRDAEPTSEVGLKINPWPATRSWENRASTEPGAVHNDNDATTAAPPPPRRRTV